MQSEPKERRTYLIDVLNTALARDYLSKSSMQDLIEFLERDVRWQEEVMEALLQCGAYRDELELDPKKAVKELLRQECLMMLDPLISLEAQNLIRAEREACLAICLQQAEITGPTAVCAYQCAVKISERGKM